MLTRIGSSSNEKTAITTPSGEPNWSFIPSAGKCKKSKDILVSEIKELAGRAAIAGSATEKEQIGKQVLKLRADYLSEVAPDRKSLYHQAENALKGQNGKAYSKQVAMGELSLLYFLERSESKQSLSGKSISLAGGATLTCPIMTDGGCGAVIEKEGVQILLSNGAGWGYEMTPAELRKKDEFYAIYNKALREATNSLNEHMREVPDYLDDRPAFDCLA